MAEVIISRFARLLDDFTKDGGLRAVGGEFDKLKKTVSFLQNTVLDAERRRFQEEAIEEWLGDLKAAFYDAEDLLEEWNIEVMRPEWPEMRARARDIRERIEDIAAEGRDLDLRESAEDVRVGRGARNRERSDSFVHDEEEIIGREDAKSAIMKFLLDSDTGEQISVLSICGESGIGKTALARCLYENDTVKKHFDLRRWVCVGDDFRNLEGELRNIRGRETTQRADDMEQLQKYLLVIDDLWFVGPERWRSLKSLLMVGAQRSKILITACHRSAADLTGTTPSYCLEALPENSSLDLLMRMACQEEEETRDSISSLDLLMRMACEEEEETRDSKKLIVGRRIVKKCGGIPLVIRIIGGLLFFEKTAAEWLHFENEISNFSADFRDLNSIVELSYICLPSHLRRCFAFCSLFPKDSVIDKLMLTSLWMAEGFIRLIGNGDHDMEDIAHDYFMDQLRRNFFQDCTKDEFGKVTSCKMHDLMNDLARRVAGTEYERFKKSLPLIAARTRHIACDSILDLPQGYPNILRAKRVRTFIKTSQRKSSRCEIQMAEKTLRKFISSFELLRALDWHDSGIGKLPSSICELKHLTFLDLSENEGIVRLPDSMTRLEILQVLKLNMCYKLMELPRDIRKLVNLRQLEISNCNALSHIPSGLDQLTLLRTLTDFLLPGDDYRPKKYSGLGELSRLSNLRGSLRIEVKGPIKDAVANSNSANLKEKDYLVSLVFVFPGKESDEIPLRELQPSLNLQSLEIRGYGGTRFPSWCLACPS